MRTVKMAATGLAGQDLDDQAYLRANDQAYRWVVAQAVHAWQHSEFDEALRHVATAAEFASSFHTGRFADGRIENIAWHIGRADAWAGPCGCLPRPGAGTGGADRRRVVHVATHVAGVGGHSRMLGRWMRGDAGSEHSMVVTGQGSLPIPAWLAESARAGGGTLEVLPRAVAPRHKAARLRELVRGRADLVVLHHDPRDIVPTLAFAGGDMPPVVVLNHADHQFWMGSSVADAVINLRSRACEHTRARRQVKANLVLPVPLDGPAAPPPRAQARSALGIPGEQCVLLSIGRGIGYRPSGSFDFAATAGRILERVPQAHLYVVSESAEGIRPHLRAGLHERLHFVGEVPDLSAYRAAADVYLESFPFGSQTALLESALAGLPVVRAYAPPFELLVAQDGDLEGLLPTPASEQQYVEQAVALAAGAPLRARLLRSHVGEGWLQCLRGIYQVTDRLSHAPRAIHASDCGFSGADVCLSHWQALPGGAAPAGGVSAAAVALHSASVAWRVRDMAACRRHALQAVLLRPAARHSWRLLGISLLGRPIQWLRKRRAAG